MNEEKKIFLDSINKSFLLSDQAKQIFIDDIEEFSSEFMKDIMNFLIKNQEEFLSKISSQQTKKKFSKIKMLEKHEIKQENENMEELISTI